MCCALSSRDYQTVCNQIDEQGETPKHNLRRACERTRIEHRQNVVLDEAASVSWLSAALTEEILERRQVAAE
jgi:hypothetical protein